MNSIKITVIIPHYQSTETLKKCLQSIPKDSCIQVIVVDDHSPKIELLEEVKAMFSQFTFIRLEQNGGAGRARNEGLKIARGKWLIFADADDYFLPNAFDYFIENYENNADIIHFKAQSWDLVHHIKSNRYLKRSQFVDDYIKGERGAEENLRYRWHGPCAKMIRKALVDEYNIVFDETRYSNDAMFSIKAGHYAKKIDADCREVYCVTVSSNSLTKKVDYNSIMCRYEVLCRCNNFLKSVGQSKNQGVVLRFYVMALRFKPKCLIPMLKLSFKYHISIFAGMNKWVEIFKRRTAFSHF